MRPVRLLFAALAAVLLSSSGPGPATLYTVGDSTMAENPYLAEDPTDPGRGWVDGLPQYLDAEKIVIRNVAVYGRSTKSYIDQGRWQSVVDRLRPGDMVLIQFGHNDQKSEDPARYTDPQTTYRENLRKMIAETREKGAIPMLATSIVRRHFNADGTLQESIGRYVPAALEVGAETGTPCVDMNAMTKKLVEGYGPEASKALYIHVGPGLYKRFPDGKQDDTHLCVRGAEEFSRLFVNAVRQSDMPLKSCLIP